MPANSASGTSCITRSCRFREGRKRELQSRRSGRPCRTDGARGSGAALPSPQEVVRALPGGAPARIWAERRPSEAKPRGTASGAQPGRSAGAWTTARGPIWSSERPSGRPRPKTRPATRRWRGDGARWERRLRRDQRLPPRSRARAKSTSGPSCSITRWPSSGTTIPRRSRRCRARLARASGITDPGRPAEHDEDSPNHLCCFQGPHRRLEREL